jgi:hypothetical protein
MMKQVVRIFSSANKAQRLTMVGFQSAIEELYLGSFSQSSVVSHLFCRVVTFSYMHLARFKR